MNALVAALPKVFLEKRLDSLLSSWRNKFGEHPITIELWNGKRFTLGESFGEESTLVLRIRSPEALGHLIRPSLASLGTAYVEGYVDFEGRMMDAFDKVAGFISSLRPDSERPRLRKARHTRQLDAKSIAHHYDLSNDFYRLWLDENMVYSCAYFRSPADTLEQAQIQKIDHILNKIQLQPGERLLDIGCGWGALVIRAAQKYGARCIGITLSRAQFDEATQRVRQAGLQDRCEIRLQDYRDVNETFDRITSVGMFEHVGLDNLRSYFRKIHDLLRDGGVAMNHGITLTDAESGQTPYGGGDFIGRYVFPNGELPHVGLVLKEISAAGLETADVENLRVHYARTLEHWSNRFEDNAGQLKEIAGDKRYRVWRAYLAGCAYGFANRWISLHQIVACKAGGNDSYPLPLTREYMYSNA
ncbi:MAG: cyclopropane-fatty-acyl-phospholipid synthase family protein [Propionivibrio sp.]